MKLQKSIGWLEQTVQKVYSIKLNSSPRLNMLLCIGLVRKQLGLSFVGETRDDQHLVLGDIHLGGLDRDVRIFLLVAESC